MFGNEIKILQNLNVIKENFMKYFIFIVCLSLCNDFYCLWVISSKIYIKLQGFHLICSSWKKKSQIKSLKKKVVVIPLVHKLFQNIKEETFPNSFFKAKHYSDAKIRQRHHKKEKITYRPKSLRNTNTKILPKIPAKQV